MIFRNIYVSSVANLVHVERVLSEKLRICLFLFFLLVKMADRGHSKTSIVLYNIYISNILMANFISWQSSSTICMNFI